LGAVHIDIVIAAAVHLGKLHGDHPFEQGAKPEPGSVLCAGDNFIIIKLIIRATSHDSSRVDCGKNFRQNKAENRRNTLCISRFDNAVMAEIFRKTPKMQ
jgi:hypothetical protein